jgi:tetratricopeptide (TPR) repeat protein
VATRWSGWLAAGLAVLVIPALAGGQERAKPQDSNRPPESARPRDGAKAPDRRMQAEAHYELGVMHHERVFESLDQAIAEYQQAVKLRPDYAEAYYHLGLSFHTKAKLGTDEVALYRKALAAYKSYLKYSPQGELAAKAKQNIRVVEARLKK